MSNPYTTSVDKIMRMVANLPDDRVEEVFQGVGRMPQITSHVLNHMAKVMSDIFEKSREAPIPGRRRSTRHSARSTQPTKRATRSSTKLKKKAEDSESSADTEETETADEDTESEQEESAQEQAVVVPPQPKAKVFNPEILSFNVCLLVFAA